MIWVILTFVFGWLLCGALSLRMVELADDKLIERGELCWVAYAAGPFCLLFMWIDIWPKRIWKFAKGIVTAWKQGRS